MIPVFLIDKIQRKLNTERNLARMRALSKSLETIRIASSKPTEVQDQEKKFDIQDIDWRRLIFVKNERPRVFGPGNRELLLDDFDKVKEITVNTSWSSFVFNPGFQGKQGPAWSHFYDAIQDKSNWLYLDPVIAQYEEIWMGKTGKSLPTVQLSDMKFYAKDDYGNPSVFEEVPSDQLIFATQKSGHGFPYAIKGFRRPSGYANDDSYTNVPKEWKVTINQDVPVNQWKIDSFELTDAEGDFLRLFEHDPVIFMYGINLGPMNTHTFKVNYVSVEFH